MYIFLLYLLFAAAFDLRERRVPNWLVIAGCLSAALTLLLDIQPLSLTGTQAVTGAFAGFFGLLIFYVLGLMGAGDVKFAGALGLWIGWQMIIPVWAVGTMIAGMHGVFTLITRWLARGAGVQVTETKTNLTQPARFHRDRWKRETPYAACLAAGTVIVMFWNSAT